MEDNFIYSDVGDLKGVMYIIFYNVTHDASIIIAEFWLLLIHTLCGQYESFTRNVDVIFRKHMHFKRLWGSMLIFREDANDIIWMYIIPIILISLWAEHLFLIA